MLSLFQSRAAAEAAVRNLKQACFTDEDIGLAMQDADLKVDRDAMESGPHRTVESAPDGGLAGGLIGLLGSLLVPGLGPVLLGGVLASALIGEDGGAAPGGLVRPLVSAGVSEGDARRLEKGLYRGQVLVSVTAAARIAQAAAILKQHNPEFTCIGSLGWAMAEEPPDRRRRDDPGYSGPERRLATV